MKTYRPIGTRTFVTVVKETETEVFVEWSGCKQCKINPDVYSKEKFERFFEPYDSSSLV